MPFEPTDEQAAILGHVVGRHARILAGPGTGKSSTLVALLAKVLEADPNTRVKMLTFTRAATADLAGRVLAADANAQRPSTIHSFAISILLRNPGAGGFPEPLRIADTWEAENVVDRTLAARMGVGLRVIRELIREMAANWESLTEEYEPDVDDELRTRFRGAWGEHRRVLGYTLLQELPFALRRALTTHNDLVGLDYHLMLVDEYQDLNACDLEVIRLMSQLGGAAIIGTGDDDQSIYSWRKAAPEGIRRFLVDYQNSADYTLSKTLRCARHIIQWANDVIGADPDRPANRAVLRCSDNAPDGQVALLAFPNEAAEAAGVARLVETLVTDKDLAASDILILLRGDHNRTFSTPFRNALVERHISCHNPDYVIDLLNEPTNRRFLEVGRLLVNRSDSLAWASVLELTPGVGLAFHRYVYEHARATGITFADALLTLHVTSFPNAPRGSGCKAAFAITALLAFLDSHPLPDDPAGGDWLSWLQSLGTASVFPAPSVDLATLLAAISPLVEEDASLGRVLSQIEPLGKDYSLANGQGVRIMTMSGSKGLTVRATIVVGVEDGIIPRPVADLGEERRVLYVAMTRAKEYLFCTWARRRRGPTARAGQGTMLLRQPSHFFDGGPVASQDGNAFVEGFHG